MSEQDQNKWIAEKVMGWELKNVVQHGGSNHGNHTKYWMTNEGRLFQPSYKPKTNDTQAIQALVQWLEDGEGKRDYDSSWCKEEGHIFMLSEEKKDRDSNIMYWSFISEGVNKSLSAAITEALCKSSGYREVSGCQKCGCKSPGAEVLCGICGHQAKEESE